MFVPFIFWMNRYCDVCKYWLRSGCCNCERAIIKIIKLVIALDVVDFKLRKTCATAGAVVNNPLSPVNQAFVIEFFKSPINDFNNVRVKCKLESAPIGTGPKPFHLTYTGVRVLLDVVPNHFVKRIPVVIKTAFAFFSEFLFKNILSLNACVIGSRKPKGRLALHSVVAG